MSGLSDKISGSAKDAAGKITGDKKLEAEGKAEKIVGDFKDKAEEVKDKAGKAVNSLLDKAKDKLEDKK